MVFQQVVILPPFERGFHVIDHHIFPLLTKSNIQYGVAHLFIQHTSASLSINENADPTVRLDYERFFNELVPENTPYFLHNYEGSDDMPAHIKSSLLGSSVSFPVSKGKALLGTWQGIYLCEHRNHGGSRKVVLTIYGE
ncbi:MAG: secondary thiamine-phosphate synthase enzyme YjbQ [Cyclobacteriaceae bacterium]|nr:secondary thiamine-phosphate synthase enzyme YjbQ [Cyclobacteriaceae bacterium]